MAVKKLMKKFHPLPLYIMLVLTIFYFLLQIIVSYVTHALTLTIDSYLMLCNLIALFGWVITIKVCDTEKEDTWQYSASCTSSTTSVNKSGIVDERNTTGQYLPCEDRKKTEDRKLNKSNQRRLKNTFGWARVDVLVMLVGCVTFASLCFSTVLEALQTMLHISHEHEMHYPIPVFCVGAFGLILNGLSYLLIGGYTFHHGSCLRITPTGVVVLDNVSPPSGERILNLRSEGHDQSKPGFLEMCRDVIGCIFVMTCSAVVYFNENTELAKLADPIFAIISAVFLLTLTYRYMKESCCILLQTIPNHINVDLMCKQLIKDFPDVLNVHDLHVWQYSQEKTFLTAHIIFSNPQVFAGINKKVSDFFHDRGITMVAIQPEFYKDTNCLELISSVQRNCLVKCISPECYQRYCCDLIDPEELKSICIPETPIHELENVLEIVHSSALKLPPPAGENDSDKAEVVENSEPTVLTGNKNDDNKSKQLHEPVWVDVDKTVDDQSTKDDS